MTGPRRDGGPRGKGPTGQTTGTTTDRSVAVAARRIAEAVARWSAGTLTDAELVLESHRTAGQAWADAERQLRADA